MQTKLRVAVIGVDMGATGDDALHAGLRMVASGMLEKLHLLHIVDPKRVISDSEQHAMATEEWALASGPSMLETRAELVAEACGIAVPAAALIGHARLGDAAATLLQMCVDYEADLLIVGTHGRRGFERWLEGSVAEQVVQQARCPVLVARPKNYEGATKTALPDAPYAPGERPARHATVELSTQRSTTLDSWSPSNDAPTGFRIV